MTAERRLTDGIFDARAGVAARQPRCSPSVEKSEMQRTVLSPSCCTASMTMRRSPVCTSMALLISGSFSGRELHVHHRADDPFDDTVFHTFSLRGTRRCRRGVNQILCDCFECGAAADDLGDLGRDGGLTRTG